MCKDPSTRRNLAAPIQVSLYDTTSDPDVGIFILVVFLGPCLRKSEGLGLGINPYSVVISILPT